MISGDHLLSLFLYCPAPLPYYTLPLNYFDTSIRLYLTLTALAYVLLSCPPFNFSLRLCSYHGMT